ncbi:helix-turn-helix domain-containing protein [Geobacillus subterraneus]|uniref:helix-turn-helix domain-containing protein n=1 Tax=Geobacillus subterraneus TaxID=129338 RepID=UPI001442AC39|nr:helix-turn-helix transcriptional regulator [Geobacillus subterraneus]QIZ69144.1 helix-turn-helix transcriptional regulator [Geobacillus subterraneus]
MEINWGDVGRRIKNLRRTRHLNASDFAEQMGVATRTLSKYENGHTSPNVEFLIQVARTFNVSLDYIVFGSDDVDDIPFKDILNALSDEGKKALASIAEELINFENTIKGERNTNDDRT